MNANAAGIDVGAASHFVAVPADRDEQPVREFAAFTGDLYRMADWLTACGIETVAMESTGVYWIPLFQVLEERGFEVKLVDARQLKRVPGRKSDVVDCQWLQQLHTFGLLAGAFRPDDQICVLRSYMRQRAMLVAVRRPARPAHAEGAGPDEPPARSGPRRHHRGDRDEDHPGGAGRRARPAPAGGAAAWEVQALRGDDRRGVAGGLARGAPVRAGAGGRPGRAATRPRSPPATRASRPTSSASRTAATGEPPPAGPPPRADRHDLSFDATAELYRLTGVDLTAIDGLQAHTVLKVLSETGLDMTRWPSAKHFGSWLGLAPNNRVSGGKILSRRTRPTANRAATALRVAAQALHRSKSALGAFLRRKAAHLGMPKAITATAYKLARIIYAMLTDGTAFVERGQDYYERAYQDRVLKSLTRRAQGPRLSPRPAGAIPLTLPTPEHQLRCHGKRSEGSFPCFP